MDYTVTRSAETTILNIFFKTYNIEKADRAQ